MIESRNREYVEQTHVEYHYELNEIKNFLFQHLKKFTDRHNNIDQRFSTNRHHRECAEQCEH
jgi:hypothetical protein